MTQVLALDVGTSSVKARVYDERGSEVEGCEGKRSYELRTDRGGRAEFDADELVEAARAALGEARAGTAETPAAVGISCFWHSLLALDRRGRPISPVLTWRDTRSVGALERLAEQLDAEAVHARTGCPLHPSFWPGKLAWLRQEQPEVFESARFVSLGDYLLLELAGELRTSLSMASGTGLLDVNECAWDAELLDALGLDPDCLPPISDEPVGRAEPWFPALGDGACSNVGVGCVTRGRAALTMGTSGAYRIAYDADRVEPRPGLFCYRLDQRRFVEGGSLSDGGNLYAWLERTLRVPDDLDLAHAEPDGHGLTFLPLLGGERSPGWKTDAHGAVAGLRFETTAEDIAQAALEGVAYRFAEIADLLPEVEEIVTTGNALDENPAWVQILADVLGRTLTASAVVEGSARGAAIVALERLAVEPDAAPLGEAFEPRADRNEVYRAARGRQRELYAATTELRRR